MSIFLFKFVDVENDRTILRVSNTDVVSSFVRQTDLNKNEISLYLQTNEALNTTLRIVIQYTDYYHQEDKYYKNIELDLSIFEVDPPYFDSDIKTINVNRWSDIEYKLPSITDPNGFNCTLSVYPSYEWITPTSNNSLYFLTSNKEYNISNETVISIKIENEKKAWRVYNITIITDKYILPFFEYINDFDSPKNEISKISINFTIDLAVEVIDWFSLQNLSWIKFENKSQIVIDTTIIDLNKQWVLLKAYDSWGKEYYSNKFTITIQNLNAHPLAITGTFGPLTIYVGTEKIFLISPDLYYTNNNDLIKGMYVTKLNWTISAKLKNVIEKSTIDDSYYLYLLSNNSMTWYLSLNILNSKNQTTEVIFQVNVLQWASKDCIKWTTIL